MRRPESPSSTALLPALLVALLAALVVAVALVAVPPASAADLAPSPRAAQPEAQPAAQQTPEQQTPEQQRDDQQLAALRGSVQAAVPSTVVVSPDPDHDLYVGTGGLLVPGSRWRGSDSGRRDAASCLDCQWRVSVLCTKAESAAGNCLHEDIGCPVGTVAVRIWLLRPGQDWEVVGRACQGDTPPVTVTDVGSAVRDRAEAALPPLRAAVQPAGGALVRLPALFRTGQPAAGISGVDLSVLGLDVRLTSRVRWHWDYGDGTDEWTSQPGGAWPVATVSHAYLHAATARATVAAVWRGEFTVEGLGPFVVPGAPLEQDAAVPVVVRPAHAHLVG